MNLHQIAQEFNSGTQHEFILVNYEKMEFKFTFTPLEQEFIFGIDPQTFAQSTVINSDRYNILCLAHAEIILSENNETSNYLYLYGSLSAHDIHGEKKDKSEDQKWQKIKTNLTHEKQWWVSNSINESQPRKWTTKRKLIVKNHINKFNQLLNLLYRKELHANEK